MLTFIIIFALILVILGAYIGQRAQSASDFFVGGRNFNSGILFTTLIAANLGAGSTVGVIIRFVFFPRELVDGHIQPLVFEAVKVFPLRINLV